MILLFFDWNSCELFVSFCVPFFPLMTVYGRKTIFTEKELNFLEKRREKVILLFYFNVNYFVIVSNVQFRHLQINESIFNHSNRYGSVRLNVSKFILKFIHSRAQVIQNLEKTSIWDKKSLDFPVKKNLSKFRLWRFKSWNKNSNFLLKPILKFLFLNSKIRFFMLLWIVSHSLKTAYWKKVSLKHFHYKLILIQVKIEAFLIHIERLNGSNNKKRENLLYFFFWNWPLLMRLWHESNNIKILGKKFSFREWMQYILDAFEEVSRYKIRKRKTKTKNKFICKTRRSKEPRGTWII